jgi:uncharacterized membrane protein
LFFALVIFALIVRAVDNTHITATLTGDEGTAGLSAVAFREGRTNNIFSTGYRGFPMLYFFMQSLPVAIFGRTVAALRISSALAGALTVGGVFLAGSALFGRRAGLLAAIFLSDFHFHIHFSRIGLNNIWDGLFFTTVVRRCGLAKTGRGDILYWQVWAWGLPNISTLPAGCWCC